MNTTADKLELLLRTKERQKAYLQQKYPLLDFDTIPFRAYLDLFQGRSYVPGLVAAWKTYGKRNDDADRDDLYDYSGNGRDIKLYNFAFSGMSGYGGAVAFMSAYWSAGGKYQVISADQPGSTRIADDHFEITSPGANLWLALRKEDAIAGNYNFPQYTIEVDGLEGGTLEYRYKAGTNLGETKTLNLQNGKNVVPGESFSIETLANILSYIELVTTNAIFTKLDIRFSREYSGALVSDGVDDYGRCIKDFALPDDYTVVAIRKIIDPSIGSALSGKSRSSRQGAFIIDYYGKNAYSYGGQAGSPKPEPLFSYLTKTSYNGRAIQPGTGTDTEEDKVYLFTVRGGYPPTKAALYDLRIYDHSLTAEELQTVKDEMMSDYENATGGGITDITYVADWDGKGRSNDEEEPMRSQWTDKATGKVINLSNYSYSQMSGWGGFQFDWSAWQSDIAANGGTVIRTQTSIRMTNTGRQPSWTIAYTSSFDSINSFRIRVSGLKPGKLLHFSGKTRLLSISEDGIYTIPADASAPANYSFQPGGYSANEEADLLIEQLPLYPGALVSDGVDDKIQAEEALGEVGSVLIHWKNIGLPASNYLYNTGWNEDAGRLYCWNTQGNIACGTPHMQMDGHPIMIYHRSPLVSTVPLNNNAGENNCPIFRLIFIKEQLDEYQQEFLKWKVGKEYRDWCKENGYEYAITEMLNN